MTYYRNKHTRTQSSSACTPKATRATWHLLASSHQLYQRIRKVNIATCIPISRQQCRTYHHMMLRTMHVAKRHRHHLLQNLNRISRRLIKTNPINRINTPRMALITNIMTMLTTSLAILHLMAYSTLHRLLLFQIYQRSTTYQTFFFHNITYNFSANIQKNHKHMKTFSYLCVLLN